VTRSRPTPGNGPSRSSARARQTDIGLSPADLREEWRALREAQLEVEISRQHYADLYDVAPVGYLTLDGNGCIRNINLAGAELLDRKRSRLIGTPFLALAEQPDRRKFLTYLNRLRRGQNQASSEVKILNRGGRGLVVELVGMLQGPGLNAASQIHMAMVDVTDRKQAEEALRQARDELELRVRLRTAELTQTNAALQTEILAHERAEKELRESRAWLRAILDYSPTLIYLKDTLGHYLHFNRQFGRAFRVSLGQTVGKTDAEIFPPEQAESNRANDLKVLAAGVPMQFDEIVVHRDGPHNCIITEFPLHDLDGKIYALAGIVTDVTERKRLEAEILRISEREQRRIAQDLHDSLGQQLAGLWCLSDVMRKNLAAHSSPEVPAASKICKLLRAAVAQSRSLARGLYPVSPEPNGLMSALDELATRVTDLFKVSCRFECTETVPLEDNTAGTHLYRIAQEAVANAIKHGRARRIKIVLSSTPAQITLAVRDDGSGFRKTLRPTKGLGMRIMNYRADVVGGTFVVRTKTRNGTELRCTVPRTGGTKQPIYDGQTLVKADGTKKNLHRG